MGGCPVVFSSVTFLFVFLPLLLAAYYLLPVKARAWRNGVLLGFSLFFYGYGGPPFLLLMLLSIAVNYVGALCAAPGRRHAKAVMVLTTAVNLALLGWFKYAGFFFSNLAKVWTGLPVPEVTLPIGISFFTFQGLSYVLDVYQGQAQPQRNPLHVALYISLFPQLVAGPIVRYTTVAEEILTWRETISDFSAGAVRFLFGLAKKMLLANQLGLMADEIFAVRPEFLTVSLTWLGAIAYTGQIYFDFSGYSDMAIGLGHMFGFHFLENFNYPYISRSVTEFWRRWHISLSTWFRDYVYIPLGGNRCSTARHIRNILVVWALTGFWHGAAWTFLAWGLYYALLLLGEKYLWGRALERLPAPVRHVYALVLILVGWVIFRAETLTYAWQFISAMFGAAAGGWTDSRSLYYLLQFRWELLLAIPASLPLRDWALQRLKARDNTLSGLILAWGPKAAALGLFALSFLRLVSSSYNPFIYFRF